MNFKQITISVVNGTIKLMFKQFHEEGDWICVASDECMNDINDLQSLTSNSV